MSEARVNGTTLHYESAGSGPAVLLLHGFALDGRMWSRQVDWLARHHRVVAYDARGFGRSSPPGSEAYRHCDDAAALCEHLRLESVTVIGHSLGAHHALELALTRPDLVAAWGGICSSALRGVPYPDEIRELFKVLGAKSQGGELAAAKDLWGRCGWFTTARERPDVWPELEAILETYSGWHWIHPDTARYVEPFAADRLGEIGVPALVLTGAQDLPYNGLVARALLAGLPYATAIHLETAGHMANMEAPDQVSEAIAKLAARGAGGDRTRGARP